MSTHCVESAFQLGILFLKNVFVNFLSFVLSPAQQQSQRHFKASLMQASISYVRGSCLNITLVGACFHLVTASADGRAEGFNFCARVWVRAGGKTGSVIEQQWRKLLLLDTCCFMVWAGGAVQLGATLQHPVSAACGALSPLQGQGAAGCLCDMAFGMARPAITLPQTLTGAGPPLYFTPLFRVYSTSVVVWPLSPVRNGA